MDYVQQAQKFIWRAQKSRAPEERTAYLAMAEWCLAKHVEAEHSIGR